VWGLYHGFFIILERLVARKQTFSLPPFVKVMSTFMIVVFGWVLFRIPTLNGAMKYIATMLNIHRMSPQQFQYFDLSYFLTGECIFYLALCFLFAFFPRERLKAVDLNKSIALGMRVACSIVLLVYSTFMLSTSSFNPFIYFRF
jgi:alginate O-acetyltransferase complex protein AlgI